MCSRAANLRRSQRSHGAAGSLRLVLPPPREFHRCCPHQEGARAGIAAEEIGVLSSVRNGRDAFSSPRSSPTAARRQPAAEGLSRLGFPRCLLEQGFSRRIFRAVFLAFEIASKPPWVEANWIFPSKKIQERRRKGEKKGEKK